MIDIKKSLQAKQKLIDPKMIFYKLFFLFSLTILSGSHQLSTYAREGRDCYYQGEYYPHGYIIGNYICNDGRWIRLR